MNERRPDTTLIPGDSPLSHCMQIIWHFGVLFNIDWGPMQKNKDILLKLILYFDMTIMVLGSGSLVCQLQRWITKEVNIDSIYG